MTYERETEDVTDLNSVLDLPGEFYDAAGRTLLEGLRAAWQEDVFLAGGTRLVFAPAS